MNIIELILISISLALDCFAIAICISSINKISKYNMFKIPLFFGVFQAAMTLLGYFLGLSVKEYIIPIDHWIAFVLLSIIGCKIIVDAHELKKEKINLLTNSKLIVFSIATSIDAFVIGITFSLIYIPITLTAIFIGLITIFLSIIGLISGKKIHDFNFKLKNISIAAGLLLIGIGMKTLLSHIW